MADDARLPTANHPLLSFYHLSILLLSVPLPLLRFSRNVQVTKAFSGQIRSLGEPRRRDLIAGAVMCCAVWRANISGRDVIARIKSYRWRSLSRFRIHVCQLFRGSCRACNYSSRFILYSYSLSRAVLLMNFRYIHRRRALVNSCLK